MKSTKECLDALVKGKKLMNVTGGATWLDENGVQQAENMGRQRRGRPYSFSNPELWHVVEDEVGVKVTFSAFEVAMMMLKRKVLNFIK